jgi:hypothetical protein
MFNALVNQRYTNRREITRGNVHDVGITVLDPFSKAARCGFPAKRTCRPSKSAGAGIDCLQ